MGENEESENNPTYRRDPGFHLTGEQNSSHGSKKTGSEKKKILVSREKIRMNQFRPPKKKAGNSFFSTFPHNFLVPFGFLLSRLGGFSIVKYV